MQSGTIDKTTFCTGLWHLRANRKKTFSQYLEILPQTLSMISGGKLIVFSDETAILEEFAKVAARFEITVLPSLISIKALPMYEASAGLLQACVRMGAINWLSILRIRDRGRNLYRRQYKAGGAENYRAVTSIWLSKMFLVRDAAVLSNPFRTEYSAWMDTSVSRFNGKRQNSNFAEQAFGPQHFYLYGTKSRYKGRLMKLNASFMLAENKNWGPVCGLFEAEIGKASLDNYAHDDETILNRVIIQRPELFAEIGQYNFDRRN